MLEQQLHAGPHLVIRFRLLWLPSSRPASRTSSHYGDDAMRVGISLTRSHADAEDPAQGARWMIERTAAARHAGLDPPFVADRHVLPTPTNDQRKVPGSLERLEELCVMPG